MIHILKLRKTELNKWLKYVISEPKNSDKKLVLREFKDGIIAQVVVDKLC